MASISVCLNTQTPLVQFLPPTSPAGAIRVWPREVDLADLKEGVDYRLSPGGVTRMVYPLVRRLTDEGRMRDAHWVSLNPTGPETVRLPQLTLHNVRMRPHRMEGYGRTKEAIWGRIHGLSDPSEEAGLFWSDSFSEFAYYNRLTAELLRTLDRAEDFDLFYVHDFQQLPVGRMLDTLKPKVFRWHIPFDDGSIPEEWAAMVAGDLSAYDLVIVSTDRYRESLLRFGYKGEVLRFYPYVDPSEYTRPGPEEVAAVSAKFGIAEEDEVVLVVARMDPAKGQDRAILAFAEVAKRRPHARLVLVGNGSFSGARGGLGLSKSDRWRERLRGLAGELGVGDRVVFTGHVTQAELDALYERCRFTVLPSTNEGFGLVVVESWLHRRPAIVTTRAGVSELIEEGKNALLFDPDSSVDLARQMRRLFTDAAGLRARLVRGGRSTARKCSLEAAARAESRLFERLVEA